MDVVDGFVAIIAVKSAVGNVARLDDRRILDQLNQAGIALRVNGADLIVLGAQGVPKLALGYGRRLNGWTVLDNSPFVGRDLIEAVLKSAIDRSINRSGDCACAPCSRDQLLAVVAGLRLVDAHVVNGSLIVDPGVLG